MPVIGETFQKKLYNELMVDLMPRLKDYQQLNIFGKSMEKIEKFAGMKTAFKVAKKLRIYQNKKGLADAAAAIRLNMSRSAEIADLICNPDVVDLVEKSSLTPDTIFRYVINNGIDYAMQVNYLNENIPNYSGQFATFSNVKDRTVLDKIMECVEEDKNVLDIEQACVAYKDKEIILRIIDYMENNSYSLIQGIKPENVMKAMEVMEKYEEYIVQIPISKNLKAAGDLFDKMADFYLDKQCVLSVADSFIKLGSQDDLMENLLNLYIDIQNREDYNETANFISKLLTNSYCIENVIPVMHKYSEGFVKEEIEYVMYEQDGGGFLSELLEDYVQSAIKNSSNPRGVVRNILRKNYKSPRLQAKYDLEYEELTNVVNTWELVENIHKDRSKFDRIRIENTFYWELRRSMAQANDHKGKIRMLRQYCKEVRDLMQNNVDELMFIES